MERMNIISQQNDQNDSYTTYLKIEWLIVVIYDIDTFIWMRFQTNRASYGARRTVCMNEWVQEI